MAIVNNGTKNSLGANEIPLNYTRPTVTEIADYDYVSDLSLSVLKATVENATAATTMANIITNGTIGITKQVDDILAADYLASATVTAYADLTGLTNNFASVNGLAVYLTNVAPSYICTVKLYVKAA